jgi:hypothetical protein
MAATIRTMETLDPRTFVTLINGTFARDAVWVDRDGALAEYLRSHLTASTLVEPLRWEGGNSPAARHEGAAQLSAHLAWVAEHYPKAQHFLIAHSHGGNVALQALRMASVSVRGLICLNTPFLHCKRRSFTFLQLLGFYSFMPVVPAFLIMLYMYLAEYRPLYPDRYVWPLLRAAVWGWLWVPIGFLLVKPYERMVSALAQYFQAVHSRAERVFVPDVAPTVPLLTLTVPGDEAYWWLRLIDALSLVIRIPLYLAIASFLIALIANNLQDVVSVIGWFSESLRGAGQTVAVYSFLVALVSIGFYVVALLLLVAVLPLIRGHVLSYGEGRWESVLFDTTVKPYAMGAAASSVIRLPVWAWLRHSALYSNRQVAQLIVDWIDAQSKQTPDVTSPSSG